MEFSGSCRLSLHFYFRCGFTRASLRGYFLALLFVSSLTVSFAQRTAKQFECPQQFGYYQDRSDCNKYYICVFGDALHDKCTPGLYFNNELRMCDWPRNVKTCDGSLSEPDEPSGTRRQFGTTTSKPRSSSSNRSSRNNQNADEIENLNSISPPNPTQGSRTRYTPPISASYIAAARNATHIHFRPPSSLYTQEPMTTAAPKAATTSNPQPLPASFKPVYYRVATPRPMDTNSREESRTSTLRSSYSSNKRKDYDDEYYDDYEDDESDHKPSLNRNFRGGNNVYVTPIDPNPSLRPRYLHPTTYNRGRNPTTAYPSANYYSRNNMSYRQRPRSGNSNNVRASPTPVISSFNLRGQNVNKNIVSDSSSEEEKPTVYTYNRNANPSRPSGYTSVANSRGPPYSEQVNSHRHKVSSNTASPPTHTSRPRDSGSPVHIRPDVNRGRVQSHQSLDVLGDSLDAQFGTNPRSISLPDAPYRQNSFLSSSEERKTERNRQEYVKPVPATRYVPPPKPSHQRGPNDDYEEYPEYYYDDEDEYYDDDEDVSIPNMRPKVIIRVQKPSTTTTTRRPTAPSTTRRMTTTTRRPTQTTTTLSAKRRLPFGISRPATKRPLHTGPKPLPRLPSRPPPLYSTPRALALAEKCTPDKCALPDCRCGGTDIPGNIPAHQVPQIVLITFDDAVNDLNYELYSEIFDDRKNPNGCPILGTFYVSHEWTDYGMVQSLYSKGHEMASHSITHGHGEKFSVNTWTKEINGQREILHLYGAVKLEDIRGMRAPFLQVGGNNMFEMLYEANFTYDSSMPVLDNKPPFYPYTLDYSLDHECMIPPCPKKSFPGLWEVGMVMWNDYRGGRCSMGDACANPDNAEDVYKMLLKNFNRHYESNRAPFGLYYHAAWFVTQHFRRGYMKFIEHINSKNDVYMITNWQAIQWMREPTPLSQIKSFRPWQCPKDPDLPGPCRHPRTCSVSYKGGNRNMRTCQPCPSNFPWTGKTGFDEVYG